MRLPWVAAMEWRDAVFLHYRYAPELVRPFVPASLELDTHGGSAWVGVVAFTMGSVHARGLPPAPGCGS